MISSYVALTLSRALPLHLPNWHTLERVGVGDRLLSGNGQELSCQANLPHQAQGLKSLAEGVRKK